MLSSFNILVAKSKIHDGLDTMLTLPLSRDQHFLPRRKLPMGEHSSTYAVPFPYCFEVANEFLPSIHLLSCCLFQYTVSPEPQAWHFQMSAAISSSHSSLFPYFS